MGVPSILLIPLGTVAPQTLEWLRDELAVLLSCSVEVGPEVPLPKAGYDPRRGQYIGEAMLDALRWVGGPAERVLGLADVDCYAPGLNFIFGQAVLNGREAFVALPRLRPSFYGLPEDEGLFRQRLLKEAVHELGHTFGLGHCPDPRCVMHFSNTLHDTDVKDATFCSRCRQRLLQKE
ncbi:MAG: archaemetzincin family Zn-dependent metalloprotease [Anaerolineae bacterium]|nr:archaemetzincin family Zn-dependent metalloprotease [Anaerolineae bacterium]